MRQNVKERLNKKLSDNNMTQLGAESLPQSQQRLYKNRTYNSSECENRLINNTDNKGIPYGHGQYDDRQYDDYFTLQEPVEPAPTLLQSIVSGNEQLLIVLIFGFATYALYLHSKPKDKMA